jgi:MFS family permease
VRIASRVIGIALALAGLAFFVVSFSIVTGAFDRKSVLLDSGPGPDRTVWIAGAISAALGLGCLLAGWYFLKVNVDEIDEERERPVSRFAPFFVARRRELTIIALLGLVASLIRLGAACFGVEWPGRLTAWILSVVCLGLAAVEGQIGRPRTGVLKTIEKALGTAIFALALLWAGGQWFHHAGLRRIAGAAVIVLVFVWDALSLAFGESRSQSRPTNLAADGNA